MHYIKHFCISSALLLTCNLATANQSPQIRSCMFELEDPATSIEILQWRGVIDPRPKTSVEPIEPPLKVDVEIALGLEGKIERIQFKQEPPLPIRNAIDVAIKSWIFAQDDEKGNVIKSATVNRQYWFAHCLSIVEANLTKLIYEPGLPAFPSDSLRDGLFGSASVVGAIDDSGRIVFSDFSRPRLPIDLQKTALEHFSRLRFVEISNKNVLRMTNQRFDFQLYQRFQKSEKQRAEDQKERLKRLTDVLNSKLKQVDKPLEVNVLEFPQLSLRAFERDLQGVVEFEFAIDESGRVSRFTALKSPDALLVQLTLDAVRRWAFKPLTQNGIPTSATLVHAFAFEKSKALK
jgi:TonB family protein